MQSATSRITYIKTLNGGWINASLVKHFGIFARFENVWSVEADGVVLKEFGPDYLMESNSKSLAEAREWLDDLIEILGGDRLG